jgi:regulatory protein
MAQALAQLTGTELERAREVWHRKFGEAATEPKEHARQARFLISRGFSAEVVRKIVG